MAPSDGTRYGRSGDEWAQLTTECRRFLVEYAQKQRTTSYTELNAVLNQRTTARTFNFDLDSERAAVGELLGDVAQLEQPICGHLISAIVLYLNDNSAGSGFFNLAIEMGVLPAGATEDQKLAYWTGEVRAVHDYYKPSRRHARSE